MRSIRYNARMGKHRKKTRSDVAEVALSIVEKAIGGELAGGDTPVPDTAR